MKYYNRDDDAIAAEWHKDRKAEETQKGEDQGVRVYTLKIGRTLVRILPSPSAENKGLWFREMREYYFKIGEQHNFLTSPLDFDLPDPIWEWGQSVYKEGDEESIEEARNFRPTTRFLMNGLVLSDGKDTDKIGEGIKVLKVPLVVKRQLVNFDYEREYGHITSPDAGFNIIIDREGTGRNTKYTVMPHRERSNIFDILMEKGIDPQSLTLYDLEAVHRSGLKSEDEMVRVLEQVSCYVFRSA